MVEVSELGLKEQEIELDLGLSIGRNFKKLENPTQPPDLKPNVFDPDLNEESQNQASPGIACEQQREAAVMDPKTKREIHALRRQEAKKKRELKRAMRESEPVDHQAPKREKTEHPNGGSEFRNAMNLTLSNDQDAGRTSAGGPTVSYHTSSEQVAGGTRGGGGLTASFPMSQVRYVALNNGFALPCVVPCWAQRSVNEVEKNSVGQNGVACRGFQPYNGSELEQNAKGDRKAKSNGSSMCSSVISENRSPSHEGGSTDSRSHSTNSLANPAQLNRSKENNNTSQPQQSASSHPIVSQNSSVTETDHIVKDLQENMIRPSPTNLSTTTNHIVKDLQQNIIQPSSSTFRATSENKSSPIYKPLPKENPCNMPLKETKIDSGKPPKPKPLSQPTLLPQMPYVSTTGNGPNGKTVNGFLYRYTKSEVSIVCVCHGSTFSPAEFVQHAGGTDISQPLRHITVIPSAFG